MCDETHKCKGHTCESTFSNKEDLIRYQEWLKQELEIVDKTLQDLQQESD
jgi:hypothetical protein